MARKRNQQTIPMPDRDEAQRRHVQAEASQEGLGVATKDVQNAQDKDDEEKKVTCLDFGVGRYREWKEHGAKLCDQCDKYGNLAPEECITSVVRLAPQRGLGANLSPSVTHLLPSASLLPVELY
jgi:hypothetical protein